MPGPASSIARRSRAARAACAVCVLAALGAGCGGDDDQAAPTETVTRTEPAPAQQPDPQPGTTEPDDDADDEAAGRVSRNRAIRIAKRRVGGGRLEEAERDDDDGRAVWKVELQRGRTEYEVSIDVRTGKVLDIERDRDDDSDDDG